MCVADAVRGASRGSGICRLVSLVLFVLATLSKCGTTLAGSTVEAKNQTTKATPRASRLYNTGCRTWRIAATHRVLGTVVCLRGSTIARRELGSRPWY
jgi:hypothetical protein